MKVFLLLLALAAGVVLGYWLAPATGRYTITARDGYLLKLDTVTGRTWFDSSNGWVRFDVSADVSANPK